VAADFQGAATQQPLMYLPTTGVLEDGTIQFQLTEDGKLILPPGLKLFTADGQEVGSTASADGQVQQEQPRPVEDSSNHQPLKHEGSSEQRESASESRANEED